MKLFVLVACAILAIGLVGCEISAPYVMKTDRLDQELQAGNKGYLKGTPPPPKDRGDLKRPWIAVDIDLPEVETKKTKLKTSEAAYETKSQVREEVKQKAPAKEEDIK